MYSCRMLSALLTVHLIWLVGATKLNDKHVQLQKSNVSSINNLLDLIELPLQVKDLLYTTKQSPKNRLVLPPGALLVLTPTIQLPVYRNLPIGYGSHITVSVPFSINFDDLGMTSEENPWGLWPESNMVGGHRVFMFKYLEEILGKVGISGKECLLRTICETFETPLDNHGFIAELMELFFTVSNDPGAETLLSEYLEAEKLGKQNKSCSKFYSACGTSVFSVNGQNKKKQINIPETFLQKEDPEHTEV